MLGARIFYFIAYGLYYLSLLVYKNPMRDILFLQKDQLCYSDFLYVVYYIAVHSLAIHYFLTAGNQPGVVDEVDTQIVR